MSVNEMKETIRKYRGYTIAGLGGCLDVKHDGKSQI